MRKLLILVFVLMTVATYAQDYPKLRPLKEAKLEGAIFPYERKGKWGYKDIKGKVVFKAVFNQAELFEKPSKDVHIARVKCGDKWGMISRSGGWYMTPRYKYLSSFNKRVAIFEDEGGYGLLSHKGEIICKGYQKIEAFNSRGQAWAMKGNVWGIINMSGRVLLKPVLSDNNPMHLVDDLYVVRGMGSVGVLDMKNCRFVVNLTYDEISLLSENLLKCRQGNDVSIITKDGCLVVNKYISIEKTGDSQWKYQGEQGWGIFDAGGIRILDPIFESIEYATVKGRKVYILKAAGKYGLSDLNGIRIIPILLETNQFESSDNRDFYECWYEGQPYGLMANGWVYKCNISMASICWPERVRAVKEMRTLGEYKSGDGDLFYVKINRKKEILYRDGFDEYSWANKVSELVAPNSEGRIVKVGVWLDKILKTLNVEKMAKYVSEENYCGISEAYQALESARIEINLQYNEALGDGKSLVVADVSLEGHHIQRFASILNEAGIAQASIKFDGKVYDKVAGLEHMEISVVDDYIVFTYLRFCDNYSHSDVYTKDLKFQFAEEDSGIEQLVCLDDAYFYTTHPCYSDTPVLQKYNKKNAKYTFVNEGFSGVISGCHEFVFINDESESAYDGEVQKFFTLGRESEVISAIAFSNFTWDGCKVVMMYVPGCEPTLINYGSRVSLGGANVYLPKPDVSGLSVYRWQKANDDSVVRYGLWNEAENAFTLPLFESLEIGDQVRYTIAGKEYELSVKDFSRRYNASVSFDSGLDRNNKVSKQVADYFGFVGIEEERVEEEAIPFQLVEQKPMFMGKDANAFTVWVMGNIKYPEVARENGVQGRVTLQFTVEKDGRVTKVKVLRGVDPSLDKEAVRVVSMSPKWTPGRQRDHTVAVTYTFPIQFALN